MATISAKPYILQNILFTEVVQNSLSFNMGIIVFGNKHAKRSNLLWLTMKAQVSSWTYEKCFQKVGFSQFIDVCSDVDVTSGHRYCSAKSKKSI